MFLPGNILSWDVFGYYLYLPLTFIYKDLGINDYTIIDTVISKYHNTATFYQGIHLESGQWLIKYSSGMALMYLPFFLIGHLLAYFFSYPLDGFSVPYQYSILLGSLLYSFIGIIFLRKILLNYFNDALSAVVMIIIVLGTNYFLHTSIHGQGAMSHNYLFYTVHNYCLLYHKMA